MKSCASELYQPQNLLQRTLFCNTNNRKLNHFYPASPISICLFPRIKQHEKSTKLVRVGLSINPNSYNMFYFSLHCTGGPGKKTSK